MNPPITIDLEYLKPSKTNPRTNFDQTQLKELADNIAKYGFLQSLIVRPAWCQGCRSHEEIIAKRPAEANPLQSYEIVDGERRFRAAKIAGIPQVPCDVREMTDILVVEAQLITFLQKQGLSPLEESKGFQQLLSLKDAEGKPLHTAASIAESVGKKEDYVYERLKLSELPDAARQAMEKGKIGVKVAAVIARIPGKEMRAEAAKAILKGDYDGEPLSHRDALEYVNEHCMQELKGAPFDTNDAELDPKAGACATCPHRTGNNRALFGDVKRGDICTNPACFRSKCDLVWAKVSAEASEKPGVTVLPPAKHAELFISYGDRDELAYNSPYVDINAKPSESLLKQEVEQKKVPLWRDLIAGRGVPVVVARDGLNRVRELAKRELAIAAAIENKENIFVNGAAKRGDSANSDWRRQQKAEMTRRKKQDAISFAATRAVRDAIAKKGILEKLWPIVLELACDHAGHDGLWFIAKRDNLKTKPNEDLYRLVPKHLAGLPMAEKQAAAVELLYMQSIRFRGADHEQFKAIAELYGVDLAKVKADVAAAEKEKKKPKTSAADKAVKAIKESKPKEKKGGAK